jgi:hypothetical protein
MNKRPRSVGRLIIAAAVGGMVACANDIEPLGPTPLDEGIIVYLHSGYRGTSQQVGVDVPDLGKVEGPCSPTEGGNGDWDDCISSIRVMPGWGARIYDDKDFRGAVLEVNEDIPDLSAVRGDCSGSHNDCITSIRVFRK